ncbi:sec-independent translocase [Kribbella sp. NPDC051952]|jgi:sec-independent protein translocase protein TatB|uniref:sec-independent translocase n=1 Tax=Kribbella sp. NPDC051952 TaxID=3154851 RepID=UPI0034266DD8
MFGIGPLELVVIAIVAILVFGPDRLPEFARTAGRLLRQVRQMVTTAQNDLRNELGPEFADLELQDLNPKNFVRKHLLEGADDFDEKPVADFADSAPERLPAGQRPPYDPEST